MSESKQDADNKLLRIDGKIFYYQCGCNVFHQPNPMNISQYRCNSCDTDYIAKNKGK